MASKTKIGNLGIAKKMFGNLEIVKEVVNGIVVYELTPTPSGLLAPTISLYDSDTALKIESANDEEDQYEIYVDDVLVGTYNKFYDFEASSSSLTKCLGRQYYTGEIVTPQTVNNTSIITLGSGLFGGAVASKITISEGVTTAPTDLFNYYITTVNVVFPSTITSLQALNNYFAFTLTIGLSGYIEYGWTTALPTPSGNQLCTPPANNVYIYVKSTIVTLNNYCLYLAYGTPTGSTPSTVNLYFDESENETMTIGTNLIYVGVSKRKMTYNVYTDNASIKDTLSAYAGSYCTVNVYKRDGGAW